MPDIQVGFGCAPIVVALLFLLSAVLSILLYRYTIPPTSRLTRVALALLRGTALFLLLALLCEPVLQFVRTSVTPPALAVLVDNTASMRLRGRSGDRETTLRSVVGSPALDRVARTATLLDYCFSTSLKSVGSLSPDSLRLEDEGTDISNALQSLAPEQQRKNIRAVLLITDGAYTRGQNPMYVAEGYPVPIFPVPIGDSTEQKDIAITRIAANAAVYSGVQTPVDVTVKSTGYEHQLLDVTLMDGSAVLNRRSLRTEAGTHEYAVQLSYVPQGQGTKRYTVRVSSLPDELTTRNNARSFMTRIRKSKLLIVMLAGAPSPDVAMLRQTLAEESNYDIRSFTQRQPSGFYEGTLSPALLDSADCIILLGIPTSTTPPQTLELIRNQFLTRKKPCLFIGARSLNYARLDLLGPVIPFSVAAVSQAEQEVFFAPSNAERTHPLLTLGGSEQNIGAWEKLPPVFRTRAVIRPKPGARVLGTAMQQRIILPDPLMLIRTVDQQKTLALPFYGLWRWRLMAQGTPETSTLLYSFLTTAVKWLTTPEESRTVIVSPLREAFAQGESIEFQGQVYDQTLKPLDNAQVEVRVWRDTTMEETVLRSLGNGRYDGSIAGLSEGSYAFRATAGTEGTIIGADSGRFTVGGLEEEFVDTRMNALLLRNLAQKTGGREILPEQIDTLSMALVALPSFKPQVNTDATTLDLRTWYAFAGLIILLLAAEWLIRRRTGML